MEYDSKFAPWPWEATDENEVIDKDGFTVAIADDFSMHVQWQKANPTKVWYMHEEGRKERNPDEVSATTSLIAAAPELYDVLKNLCILRKKAVTSAKPTYYFEIIQQYWEMTDYVLAKAEGCYG